MDDGGARSDERGDALAATAQSDELAETARSDAPADAGSGDALADTAAGGPPALGPGETRRVGTTIGRYVIEGLLGAGGMGVVYAARDPDLDRRVALKLLHERGDRGETHNRFLREARAMARVEHTNVITVHEVASAGGVVFVAMELIDGPTLAAWLRASRRAPGEVLGVFRAAGRGLAAAHAAGLVHRDFKPANVMIGRGGRVVVTDFGLARAFADDEAETEASAHDDAGDRAINVSSTLTRTGAVLGTPAYMAPEQFAGAATDPRTNQFAFAIAMWEALAGARPFRGDSVEELRDATARAALVGGERIPRRLRRVLERALAPDPAARWGDLDEMLAAVDRAERRPRQLALAASAVVVLGAVGAVATVAWSRGGARAATCAISDADLAEAWSPSIAARLDEHFGHDPAWQRAAEAIDDVAGVWRSERARACAAPEREFHGRVACLLAMRDELGALLGMAEQAPLETIQGAQVAEILADPTSCRSGGPAGRPPLPADPEARAALSAIQRNVATAVILARAGDGARARAMSAAALERARARADALELAVALHGAAVIEHVVGACGPGGTLYAEAALAADRAQATGMRAMAKLGQLECAFEQGADREAARVLVAEVEAAIDGAGGDRSLRAALDATLASADAVAGNLDRAIERVTAAHATFAGTHEHRRASFTASLEARLRLMRGAAGDAARAFELLREAVADAERAYGPDHPITRAARDELAEATATPPRPAER